ncbi:MAG: hypothetical protein JWQ08_2846 [Deinococcus sp.]|nr:hypothetical protein [Deinococcus sp.]
MSFVRKPRPYSSGLSAAPLPPVPTPTNAVRQRTHKREKPARSTARQPRSSWATAVTALAVLGILLISIVGMSGLASQVWQAAQFRSAAAGISDVAR